MLDVTLNCMAGLIPPSYEGEHADPHSGRFLPTSEPGRFVAVEAEDCEAHPEIISAVENYDLRTASSLLQSAGLRAGAVFNMLEVIDDPQLRAAGFVLDESHPVAGVRPLPAVPWKVDGQRPTLGQAPLLGDSTEWAIRV